MVAVLSSAAAGCMDAASSSVDPIGMAGIV
jgi:hypothetical protein